MALCANESVTFKSLTDQVLAEADQIVTALLDETGMLSQAVQRQMEDGWNTEKKACFLPVCMHMDLS